MKQLPVGISDFKEVIQQNYYFIDKSHFVEDVLKYSAKVSLFLRPRRFGKTLNMSMLKYFFENKDVRGNRQLFRGLFIHSLPQVMEHQGKYPVIHLSFNHLLAKTYKEFLEQLSIEVTAIFLTYKTVIRESGLDEDKIHLAKKIFSGLYTEAELKISMYYLTDILSTIYKQKVIVLLDEYDTPVYESFGKGYYKEMIEFLRGFLTPIFKDNEHLEKGLITGIVKVAKEGIFSGLDNMEVFSIADDLFARSFGFTEKEMDKHLSDHGMEAERSNIKSWYNGYMFGEEIIYNPWSILHVTKRSTKEKMNYQAYWSNTSSHAVILEMVEQSSYDMKQQLQLLLEGKSIQVILNENMMLWNAYDNKDNIWNFLLCSGYLTVARRQFLGDRTYLDVKIPNKEVMLIYKDSIMEMINGKLIGATISDMLGHLENGDLSTFAYIFETFIGNTWMHHRTKNVSEQTFHSFLLGILVSQQHKYIIRSKKPSGFGRYDIMLMPKDTCDKGIILELKSVLPGQHIRQVMAETRKRIVNKTYREELEDLNVKDILEVAIVMDGKTAQYEILEWKRANIIFHPPLSASKKLRAIY